MGDRRFEKVLDECLALLDAGVGLEAVLERYPDDKSELKPLLQTVGAIRQMPHLVPSSAAKAIGKQRLLEEVALKQLARRDGFWRMVGRRLRGLLRIPEVLQRLF